MKKETLYKVLINHEEQYSIWPAYKKTIPEGWTSTNFEGKREACLEHIEEVWTDMRPKSLRNFLQKKS